MGWALLTVKLIPMKNSISLDKKQHMGWHSMGMKGTGSWKCRFCVSPL